MKKQAMKSAEWAFANLNVLPKWEVYCEKTSPVNALKFTLNDDGFQVWFSYKIPVAFRSSWCDTLVVRENRWTPTTGKHINAIDSGDKSNRVSGSDFERLLHEAMGTSD